MLKYLEKLQKEDMTALVKKTEAQKQRQSELIQKSVTQKNILGWCPDWLSGGLLPCHLRNVVWITYRLIFSSEAGATSKSPIKMP